jgi:hypothetical protein
MRLSTSCAATLFLLSLVSAASAAPRPAPVSSLARDHAALRTQANCPVYSGGTGILSDGDFSQVVDPGTNLPTYAKGTVFAPDWVVTKHTIDLYGSSAWRAGTGYCSVDVDGTPGPGGIRHAPFATIQGAQYTVTFLFSGNGACGPTVKTMVIKSGGQSATFTWDLTSEGDAQNGNWAQESWTFTAQKPTATVLFASKDHPKGNCGPVVAAVSVTPVSP